MADAAVEIQFVAQGAEMTQKQIITLQHQLKQLSQTIAEMPKLDIGGGANGGDVGFKKEVWREFHNIFAGIEEELDRVVQAVNKLNAAMEKSAAGGTRANTEAIKAQTAAMKDLSNTNAMLHEVLIGEAPLNVEIQKTRKGIAVASQDAAKQTENLDKKMVSASKSMKSFGNFNRGTASTLVNLLAPGLGAVVNQVNAVVAAFRAIIATPLGATLSAVASSVFAVHKAVKALSEVSLSNLNRGFESLAKRIGNAVSAMERLLSQMGEEQRINRLDKSESAADAVQSYKDKAALKRTEAEQLQKIIRDAKSRHMGTLANAASMSLAGATEVEEFRKLQRSGGFMTMDQYDAREGFFSWNALSDEEKARARESEKEIRQLEKRLKDALAAVEDAEKNAELASKKHADLLKSEAEEQRRLNEEKEKEKRLKEEEKQRLKQEREAKRLLEKQAREDERARLSRQRELEKAWDTQRDVGKDILGTYLSSGGTMRNAEAQALLKMINNAPRERREEQMARDLSVTAKCLQKISEERGLSGGYAIAG